jgi:hypothetical protein
MKRLTLALLCCAACMTAAPVAFGQQFGQQPPFTTLPPTPAAPDSLAARLAAVAPVAPLPTFNFSITAAGSLGGATFTGAIVGRSPLNRGKTTTTIPTQLIPLVITITDTSTNPPTTITYDPTKPDLCVANNPTDVSIIANSPIFTNNPWTMNGISIGNTQYIDAFQRAQFWSNVQGTPYHLILQTSILAAQALSFSGTNMPVTCAGGTVHTFIGNVDINTFDAAVRNLITNVLPPTVNIGTFPILLTKEVFFGGALGYHSAVTIGANFQIYSPFGIDTTGFFPTLPDALVLSHEMGEAINDPFVKFPGTPVWGQVGQVFNRFPPPFACQANLEVGDPLTPLGNTPSNTFVVGGYHLQELTFYSWFFGSTALGVGAGGGFSDNGTFTGFAKLCPPGGTN